MSGITNERLFFEHIARTIQGLVNTYTYVLEEIANEDLSVSASTDEITSYTFLLRKLNRAINAFKEEMKACLSDYFHMKNLNIMNEKNAGQYIKNQLNELHTKRNELIQAIPTDKLKDGLGHNYYFNENIKNLTPESIMDYFEINYTLILEKDLKSEI